MNAVESPTLTTSKTYLVTVIAMIFGVLNHVIFFTIFYKYDITPLYYYNYISLIVFSALLATVLKKKTITRVMVIASLEILVHQTLAVNLLGWDYGFQYYIIAIPGLILLGDFKHISFPIITSVVTTVILVFLYFYSLSHPPAYELNDIKSGLYLFNLISVATLLAIFSGLFAYISRQHEHALLNAHQQLYITATTDSMTQLSNRMKTFDLIQDQIVRSKRTGKPFTLAISDIDDFKNVNDTYGHNLGDEVIIAIAQLMKDSLREQDIIGRWGGEEFMIVLPDTGINDGKSVLEKLRKSIAAYWVETDTTSFNVTITIGIAESSEAETITDIIKLADDALYKGKRGSKNCIVLSREMA